MKLLPVVLSAAAATVFADEVSPSNLRGTVVVADFEAHPVANDVDVAGVSAAQGVEAPKVQVPIVALEGAIGKLAEERGLFFLFSPYAMYTGHRLRMMSMGMGMLYPFYGFRRLDETVTTDPDVVDAEAEADAEAVASATDEMPELTDAETYFLLVSATFAFLKDMNGQSFVDFLKLTQHVPEESAWMLTKEALDVQCLETISAMDLIQHLIARQMVNFSFSVSPENFVQPNDFTLPTEAVNMEATETATADERDLQFHRRHPYGGMYGHHHHYNPPYYGRMHGPGMFVRPLGMWRRRLEEVAPLNDVALEAAMKATRPEDVEKFDAFFAALNEKDRELWLFYGPFMGTRMMYARAAMFGGMYANPYFF